MNQVAVWLSALAIGSLGFSGMESDAKAEAETSGAPAPAAQAAGLADGVCIHARDSPILSQADGGAFASSTASLSKAQCRLAEFVLRDSMRIYDFPEEMVIYPVEFPPRTVKAAELRLVRTDIGQGDKQQSVPLQLGDVVETDGYLDKATIYFRTDLPRGAERAFALIRADAAQLQGNPTKEKEDAGSKGARIIEVSGSEAVLGADRLRLKIPFGKTEYREGKPLSEVPAPLLALDRGPEWNGWKGAGRFESPQALHVFLLEAGPIEQGPLFARYRISYQLAGGKSYRVELMVQTGETHATVDEYLEGLAPEDDAYLRFDFAGIDPDRRMAMHNRGYFGVHQTVGHPYSGAYEENADAEGMLPFSLGLYTPNSLGVMRSAAFFRDQGDCALLFSLSRMSDWKTSERIVWRAREYAGNLRFYARGGLQYMRTRLEGAERHWAIALIPRADYVLSTKTPIASRRAKDEKGLAGPEVRLFQKLTEFSLNRAKDLQIDWDEILEPQFSGNLSELDLPSDDGASAARKPMPVPPISAAQWMGLFGLEGDSDFLYTLVNAFWDYSGGIGPVAFRGMPRWYGYYDQSRAHWSEEERRHVRSLLVFMADSCADDTNLPHRSMLAGHPNFVNDVKQTLTLACAVFPNHPRAKHWRDSFMEYFSEFMDTYQRKDDPERNAVGGRWTENIACYSGTALIALLHERRSLMQYDGTDLFADPRIHAWIRWYRDAMTSPHGGERYVPPEGAHATSFEPGDPHGQRQAMFDVARQLEDSAPDLSRQMRWIETNGREGARPPLASVLIRDHGPVMRHDFGGPNEAYLHLLQTDGELNYRWPPSAGVVYYGAKGRLWSYNGREDNGDQFDIGKVSAFSVNGKGLGQHATDQILYDFGFAQYCRALGSGVDNADDPQGQPSAGAPQYLARGLMLLRDEYAAIYDDVKQAAEGQFTWVNRWDLPAIIQIKPGAPLEFFAIRDSPRGAEAYAPRTLNGARCKGKGDFLTLIAPEAIEAKRLPAGALVKGREYVLMNDASVEHASEGFAFRGAVGYARPGQLALFEGESLALDGFEIRRDGGNFGFSAAIENGRIAGRVAGRDGGQIEVVPPPGFGTRSASVRLAGKPVQAAFADGAIRFAVEISQRDGSLPYEIVP